MDSENSFSRMAPPIFDGENYQLWAVRMETYLEALDLWEVLEEDYEINPLPNNPTVAQIKSHKEKKTIKSGKNNFVCCCFDNCFHENHYSHITKRYLDLSEERICWR
uniref:Phenylalanine ammonia-lyase n=1 Tax=Solanum tuberosum TaxID=4113 RepID=M1A8F6_SOLTU